MRPPLRYTATAIAAAALALLGVRPTRTVTIHPADALLVTPGTTPARARRLADSLGTARVLALTGSDSLPDAGYIARHFGDARRLHVAGWGLSTEEWEALGTAPAAVHPAPLPAGIVSASWPLRIALGDQLRVAGKLHRARRVELRDEGGVVDSAVVDTSGVFSLATTPRAAGRQLYTLLTDGARAETIGVIITAPPQWRTLLLTAAPSFEASALRDLLAARGAIVTWRSAVSRERYRAEFVNRSAAPLEGLRARDLVGLDLVVLDGRSLLALSDAERGLLERAVHDSGTGMLVLPDQALATAAASLGFGLMPDTALAERLVRPRGAAGPAAVTPVPAEPYQLREGFGQRAVLWGTTGELLAQVRPSGAGRIGLTLVTAPSRWMRAGERATYAAYWAPLLGAVAREPHTWTSGAGPALVNQAVEVLGPGRPSVVDVLGPGGTRDSVLLENGAGRFWPRRSGWHEIAGAPDAAWYVTGTESWPAWRAAERLAATARWAASAPATGPERPAQTARRPIPAGWWLALFAFSAGVLWAERRRAYIRAMPRTAVAVLLVALLGCGKSEEGKRADVARCSAVNTSAELISLCLISEHKWKDGPADSAAKLEARRIDSLRQAQEALLWNSDSVNHKAALRTCSATNDVKECLLVRHGWPEDRATRASDSIWTRNAAQHQREVRSCARGRNPIASCLMLNYKWNARLALATEDSVRRANIR